MFSYLSRVYSLLVSVRLDVSFLVKIFICKLVSSEYSWVVVEYYENGFDYKFVRCVVYDGNFCFKK